MKLSREQVLTIAALCRMKLSDEELDRFQGQLSNVLESFEILQQVDTGDVVPTAYPIPLKNVFRAISWLMPPVRRTVVSR
jgi:aspartyl-tRNA(Asn)/glutamyl-tRNA(Gln) amidotransferase subunit C